MLDVKKAIDQFTVEGKPIYVMQQAIVASLEVPEDLKAKNKPE